MAKKDSKFNYSGSPFANEVDEEMTSVNQPTEKAPTETQSGKKRKRTMPLKKNNPRTKTEDWTLVQCRLPNDLNRRMNVCLANSGVTKNDFLVEAVRTMLDDLKA